MRYLCVLPMFNDRYICIPRSLSKDRYCDVDHVCSHFNVIAKSKYLKFYAGPQFLFSNVARSLYSRCQYLCVLPMFNDRYICIPRSLSKDRYCDVDHVCSHFNVIAKSKYLKFYAGPQFLFSNVARSLYSRCQYLCVLPMFNDRYICIPRSLSKDRYCDVDHVCSHFNVIAKSKYLKFYAGPQFLFSNVARSLYPRRFTLCTFFSCMLTKSS